MYFWKKIRFKLVKIPKAHRFFPKKNKKQKRIGDLVAWLHFEVDLSSFRLYAQGVDIV